MQKYDIAWVLENGQHFILVIVPSEFEQETRGSRDVFIRDMESRAKKIGLTGAIVPVWHRVDVLFGHVSTPGLDEFLKSMSWSSIQDLADRQL